jgi:hypothetical protein
MQQQGTQASRNPASAAAIPSKVSAPEGKAPSTPSSGQGHAAGSTVKGFSGGLINGKC